MGWLRGHVELQIAADGYGNVIHLGERECSVQRRHQKIVEESPSPAVTPELRQELGAVAVGAMRSIAYDNVGTIEFLLDEEGRYYFMEMNTRIQVEHPVTEVVYGIDLVRLQIRLAAGEKLERTQESIVPRCHAIECRVNAEDPLTFAPSPGDITGYHEPGGYGVRVDATAYERYRVQPHYDSLVAKLVCWGDSREVALQRTRRALAEYVVEGIKTNLPFLLRVVANGRFRAGEYDTRLVEQILADRLSACDRVIARTDGASPAPAVHEASSAPPTTPAPSRADVAEQAQASGGLSGAHEPREHQHARRVAVASPPGAPARPGLEVLEEPGEVAATPPPPAFRRSTRPIASAGSSPATRS